MKKSLFSICIVVFSFWTFAQPVYDDCSSALQLCPNVGQTINNIAATTNTCSTCEDYIDTCFTPINSVWVSFITTNGGNATFLISNVQYEPVNNNNNSLSATVIQATTPCDRTTFDYIDCKADQVGDFVFNLSNLLPNTTYYVLISGTQNGAGAIDPTEATMDVKISGNAVDRAGAGVVIGTSKSVFCKGESTQILIDTSSCPGQKTFSWFLNGNLWFTGNSLNFYTDELVLNDQVYVQCNCFDVCSFVSTSNTLTFTVLDFSIDAGSDYSIHEGESIQFDATTNGVNYSWTPSEYLSDANSLTPIASPTTTTSYYLTATNGICTKTDNLTVIVSSQLNIPTVFSPNGDGIDDQWQITGIAYFSDVKVTVLDRWGQKVFQAVGYSNHKMWDGNTPKGKPLATSTYFYIIELNDVDKTIKKGSITIMR